ncbi:MAG TPA: tetratricopeptide repeat protein [Pyrinomonadaceae bacterium]|jgi:tetratricopeptide (TPR) repeat protein|nr:tetratricopeptide repeat protein [Pyrinomonadaceae bacterium]
MRFKSFLLALASAFLLAASATCVNAQVLQITGKVTLKQADGSVVPVSGAQVDIYRTDIKWEDHVKTNKKGEYMHAGVPFVGVFTLIVSAPGAHPDYVTGVKLSQNPANNFELQPGDGSRPTLDQVKSVNASGAKAAGGGNAAPAESKESKAAREEMLRKNKEIEEGNKKITDANETINRTFKTGNDAFAAKNYDAAIAAYNEGLAAREEPALYSNKSIALRMRGADRFNAVVTSSDQAAKTAGMDAAKKDWADAAEAGKKAMDMMSAMAVPADPSEKSKYDQNKLAAHASYAEAMRLVGTKVDQSRADEAFQVYNEYAAQEIDPAKKAQRTADAAKILFDAGKFDRAIEEYRKILANDPENIDANLYLGLALFSSGDKAKYQEAANYLGKFSDKAPETNPLKADARSIIDFLKTQENIKPEKITTGRPASGGRRRP